MTINALLRIVLVIPTIGLSAHAADDLKPRLIVQITADQLRGDLLDRYRTALPNGLGRIEAQGYWIHEGAVSRSPGAL